MFYVLCVRLICAYSRAAVSVVLHLVSCSEIYYCIVIDLRTTSEQLKMR